MLLGAHDRDLRGGPRVAEPGAVGATTHAVVARTVGRPHDHGDVRHRRVGNGVDHLRPVFGDAALLEVRADDVARDVVQEQKRNVDLVAELNELRRLLGRFGHQHPVVAEDADGIAVNGRPAAHQGRPVEGLELLEARAVHHPGNDLAHVERDRQILADDADQLVPVVDGIVRRQARTRSELAPVQVRHHLAAETDTVDLGLRQVVPEPGQRGVHQCPGEFFAVGVLAGGHLD